MLFEKGTDYRVVSTIQRTFSPESFENKLPNMIVYYLKYCLFPTDKNILLNPQNTTVRIRKVIQYYHLILRPH